jgi:hypothetical protein
MTSIAIYKLISTKGPGCAYLLYKGGRLNALNWEFNRELNHAEKNFITLPTTEQELAELRPVFVTTEIKMRTATEKLKVFCMYFKAKRRSTYTPKKQERANIKEVVVSKPLLEVYFNNTDFPLNYAKSINDYIKHYNYIRDLAQNGKPATTRYPDQYEKSFEAKLTPQELPKYWQHLRRLGWTKNKLHQWVAPDQLKF